MKRYATLAVLFLTAVTAIADEKKPLGSTAVLPQRKATAEAKPRLRVQSPVKPPPIAAVRIQQVFRVSTPQGWQESAKVQSGAVVWKFENGMGAILTCAHGIDHTAPVHLLLSPNELEWGDVVSIDKDRDLALIHAKIPANITPIKLGSTSPLSGDALLVGFGGDWWDSGYVEMAAKISGKTPINGREHLHLEAATRGGDSGGPVLHNGKLIGVHVRGDGKGHSFEVPIEEVHKFLIEKAGWKRE